MDPTTLRSLGGMGNIKNIMQQMNDIPGIDNLFKQIDKPMAGMGGK